jgi:hypothetical protein
MRSMFARVHDRTRSMVDEGLARPRQAQTAAERAARCFHGRRTRARRPQRGFWDELCGTNLARTLGISDASEESLARFDEAYFALYSYLLDYFPWRSIDRVPLGPIEVSRLRLMHLGLDRLVGLDLYAVGYR